MARHADPTSAASLMPNQRVGCGRKLLMLENVTYPTETDGLKEMMPLDLTEAKAKDAYGQS